MVWKHEKYFMKLVTHFADYKNLAFMVLLDYKPFHSHLVFRATEFQALLSTFPVFEDVKVVWESKDLRR